MKAQLLRGVKIMFIEYGYDNKKNRKADYGSNYFYYFISLKHKIGTKLVQKCQLKRF